MTDTAATTPTTTTTAPDTEATTAPVDGVTTPASQGAPADVASATSEQVQRARLELSTLPPDAEIVMVIDGKEQVTTAADAIRRLQRDVSADQRFEMAKRAKREAAEREARIAAALSDPMALRAELEAAGMSPREIAERMLQVDIEEASLTPEQRELRELKRQQAEWARQQEQVRQQQIAIQAKQNQQAYAERFNQIMDEAGIPKNQAIRDEIVPLMASRVRAALRAASDPYSDPADRVARPELLAQLARQHFSARSAAYAAAIDHTELLRKAPLDQIRAILAERAAQDEQAAALAAQAAPPAPPAPVIPGVRASQVAEQPRDERGRWRPPQQYSQGSVSQFFANRYKNA